MSSVKFEPLRSLARQAKQRRMEMQCDPSWVLDVFAERDALRAEVERLQRHAGTLLALIHRDGGHYLQRHGMEKAVADAERVLVVWRSAHEESHHLNPPSDLPPVDCPILIQLDGDLVRATRPAFVARKGDDMQYQLEDGRIITGRFPWTYP